ncbi:MAG TPA: hypothetical protein VIW03_07215 [Anaeromyxobacter sp.]
MGGRRERAAFWAVVALLVAGTGVAYRLLLGPEPGRSSPPPAPAIPAPVRLTVARASGEVTVLRAGVRTRVAPGDELRPEDAIETAPGGRVALTGGSYEVNLEEGGRFDVQEITVELSRFRLGAGLVSARVQDDPGRAVEIEAAHDAVARTTGGEMAVARSGDVVAVGVRRGTAEFRSAGTAVLLRQGEQSTAAAGKRPSAPAPIPASLLLKVSWPVERATNQRRIVVTGRTAPGAVVVLGDERVVVQPDGRFTHVVVLREGRQRLSARAHGVGGSAEAEGPPIVLDTRAPDARFDTRDLWVHPRR